MKVNTIREIDVSTASFPVSLNLASKVSRYKLYGTKSITVDIVIDPTGTPKEGMLVVIDHSATLTTTTAVSRFGDYKLTVFGTKLPYSHLSTKVKIYCEYHDSAWDVFMLRSVGVLPYVSLEGIDPAILDPANLIADPTTGLFKIKDLGVPAAKLAADAAETDKIKNEAVTVGKMADLTRGSLLVGGASDRPVPLVAKTSGKFLQGDGTDLASVSFSGDITVAAGGAATIGAGKVLSAMILAGELVAAHLSAAAAILFTQMAALTASKVPVLNASGFIEAGSLAAAKLTYLDVTLGTSAVSKVLSLDASGKINAFDVTALTYNGTLITASAAQLNFSDNLTSDIQAQLDASVAKMTNTKIIADLVAVAATLYNSYVLDTGTGTVDLTLPAASTVVADKVVSVIQKGANAGTLVANAADELIDKNDADQASIACSGDGGWIDVVRSGATQWTVIRST